mgnify:CR=1 FL=1
MPYMIYLKSDLPGVLAITPLCERVHFSAVVLGALAIAFVVVLTFEDLAESLTIFLTISIFYECFRIYLYIF